jgi:membrane fusion protein, macrolide-specific efflux system
MSNPNRTNHGRFFFQTVMLPIVLSSCFLFPKEEKLLDPPILIKPTETVFDTRAAERRLIQRTVTGPATFIPHMYVDHFFEDIGGRIQIIHVAVGDRVAKGELLAELFSGSLDTDISLQRLHLRRAEIHLEKKSVEGLARIDLELASLDVTAEKLKLDILEDASDAGKLYAQIDGTITFIDSNFGPGKTISAFQTLLRIADPSLLELRYSGSHVFDFTPGSRVSIRTRETEMTGVVTSSPQNMPAGVDEEQRRVVRIEVEDIPSNIQSGDLAQVTLVLEEKQNAVVVPAIAIREYLGRKYVYILENGQKKERSIETGIETPTEVEIVAGIDVGTEVILR